MQRIHFSPGGPTVSNPSSSEIKPPEKIGDAQRFDRSQFHVLVADSNDSTNDMVAGHLSKIGYIVTAVKNHTAALDTFQKTKRPFSLVLVNQGDKGLWLIDSIRKGQIAPDVKILLCTGNSFADKGNATDILYKPFNFDQLQEKVDSLLQN